MEKFFDLSQPLESFSKIKSSAKPELYLEEIFLLGKISEDETLKQEILELIGKISDASVVKAFKSRSKITNTDTAKDYDSRINSLVSFAKITTTLDIGKLFHLLNESSKIRTYLMIKEKSALDKNPEMLGRFNGISELSIWDAFRHEIPAQLGELTSLEKLEINNSSITHLPPIGTLANLKELHLRTGSLQELPVSLQKLTSLEKLRIDGGYYSRSTLRIPEWLGQLKTLKELELCYLTMEEIPEEVLPESLESFYIAQMKELKKIPDSLTRCSKLKSLHFATSDKIQTLPQGLEHLPDLEELQISNMQGLTQVSGELLFAPQLKKLHITGLKATVTEPEPKINTRTELYIGNIQYLAYFLKNTALFPDLETLRISIDVKDLFPEGSLAGLKKLKTIEFSSQASDSVLASLSKCPSLEVFKIHGIKNKSFPDLSALKSLQRIGIHYCEQMEIHFAKLPAHVNSLDVMFAKSVDFECDKSIHINECKMEGTSLIHFQDIGTHALHHLSIYLNVSSTVDGSRVIPTLPESISQLNDLESFYLNAAIDDIPDRFSMLAHLKKLKIIGYNYSDGRHAIKSVSDKIFSGKSIRYCHLQNYTSDVHPIIMNAKSAEEIQLDSIHTLEHLPDLSTHKDLRRIEITNCGAFVSFQHRPKQLTSINLYMCDKVSEILYEEIASMTNLKAVRLSFLGKALNRFPEEWNFLEMLELENMNIREVPPSIHSFTRLTRLGVDGLFLGTLPKELAELKQLKQLGIKSTHLTELPRELLALELNEVRMYFSKFAGHNLKREVYCVLINTDTKIVSEFGGQEYYWASQEALAERRALALS